MSEVKRGAVQPRQKPDLYDYYKSNGGVGRFRNSISTTKENLKLFSPASQQLIIQYITHDFRQNVIERVKRYGSFESSQQKVAYSTAITAEIENPQSKNPAVDILKSWFTDKILGKNFKAEFIEQLVNLYYNSELSYERLVKEIVEDFAKVGEKTLRRDLRKYQKRLRDFESYDYAETQRKRIESGERKLKKHEKLREAKIEFAGGETTRGRKARTGRKMKRAAARVTAPKTHAPRAADAKSVDAKVPEVRVRRVPKA